MMDLDRGPNSRYINVRFGKLNDASLGTTLEAKLETARKQLTPAWDIEISLIIELEDPKRAAKCAVAETFFKDRDQSVIEMGNDAVHGGRVLADDLLYKSCKHRPSVDSYKVHLFDHPVVEKLQDESFGQFLNWRGRLAGLHNSPFDWKDFEKKHRQTAVALVSSGDISTAEDLVYHIGSGDEHQMHQAMELNYKKDLDAYRVPQSSEHWLGQGSEKSFWNASSIAFDGGLVTFIIYQPVSHSCRD
ncbi:hypothetical protein BJ878DRAFT_479460 [Calycina marina]|uniref:Uncharacterized protein n=1 Tax=Calycina marina TaxID=1763456 RepID=A0A9P7Z4G0_9HELO|nr:hypothetical protein BJ878DRAFT_479460 [Calycina marina]